MNDEIALLMRIDFFSEIEIKAESTTQKKANKNINNNNEKKNK